MSGEIEESLRILREINKAEINSLDASTERLSVVVKEVNWSEVKSFELDWKVIECNDEDELMPIIKMTMKDH